MESKFDFKLKKHIWICEYEKLWKKLTLLCGLAIYVIIRGSTAPIIFENVILSSLFCSDINGDKTLYNIAISFFAAYIFYLLQVYYIERNNTLRAMTVTALDAYSFVHQVKRFLFVWDKLTEKTSDGVIMGVEKETFYYKCSLYPQIICEGSEKELKLTEKRMLEDYYAIINNKEFQKVDINVYRLFTQIDLGNEIKNLRMALIGGKKSIETNASFLETYSPQQVRNINIIISTICNIYGFSQIDEFSVTTDKKEIEEWKAQEIELQKKICRNKEFFDSLPDEYFENLKSKK
ncbi:MAG: hypothetical protein V8S74_05950 [Lachnospirales bacterium]